MLAFGRVEDDVPAFSPEFEKKYFGKCYKVEKLLTLPKWSQISDCGPDCSGNFHELDYSIRRRLLDLVDETGAPAIDFQASPSTSRLGRLDVLAYALHLYTLGVQDWPKPLLPRKMAVLNDIDRERLRLLDIQSSLLPAPSRTLSQQHVRCDTPQNIETGSSDHLGSGTLKPLISTEGEHMEPEIETGPSLCNQPLAFLPSQQEQMDQLRDGFESLLVEMGTIDEPDRAAKSKKENAFKEQKVQARKYYDAKPDKDRVWCAVLHCYGPPETRKMAHIIPRKMKDHNVAKVLGIDIASGELLYHKRMLLFLHHKIEECYDRGQLTIIPDDAAPGELKVVLIDQSIREKQFDRTGIPGVGNRWEHLDGRRLRFLNDNRPSLRSLYLHAVMCFRKAEMRAKEEKWTVAPDLRSQLFTGTAWGTPGGIGLDSILAKLANGVGDNIDPMIAASSFVGKTGLEIILYRVSPAAYMNESEVPDQMSLSQDMTDNSLRLKAAIEAYEKSEIDLGCEDDQVEDDAIEEDWYSQPWPSDEVDGST